MHLRERYMHRKGWTWILGGEFPWTGKYQKCSVFAERAGLLWTAIRRKTRSNFIVLIAVRKARRRRGASGRSTILRMDLCRTYKGKDCSAIIAANRCE